MLYRSRKSSLGFRTLSVTWMLYDISKRWGSAIDYFGSTTLLGERLSVGIRSPCWLIRSGVAPTRHWGDWATLSLQQAWAAWWEVGLGQTMVGYLCLNETSEISRLTLNLSRTLSFKLRSAWGLGLTDINVEFGLIRYLPFSKQFNVFGVLSLFIWNSSQIHVKEFIILGEKMPIAKYSGMT